MEAWGWGHKSCWSLAFWFFSDEEEVLRDKRRKVTRKNRISLGKFSGGREKVGNFARSYYSSIPKILSQSFLSFLSLFQKSLLLNELSESWFLIFGGCVRSVSFLSFPRPQKPKNLGAFEGKVPPRNQENIIHKRDPRSPEDFPGPIRAFTSPPFPYFHRVPSIPTGKHFQSLAFLWKRKVLEKCFIKFWLPSDGVFVIVNI